MLQDLLELGDRLLAAIPCLYCYPETQKHDSITPSSAELSCLSLQLSAGPLEKVLI